MTNVILQPAASPVARRNYRKTVENPVPLSRFKDHLDNDLYEKVSEVIATYSVWSVVSYVWGIRPSSKSQWDKIHRGDKVMFTWENKYRSLSTLIGKINSHSLAADLWGVNDPEDTWEYIYFFGTPVDIDIPCTDINTLLGYLPKWSPQSVTVLSEDKAQAIIEFLEGATAA